MQTQTRYRLLVVRLGAMGDILHALPAVTALRLAHPHWVIDWVVDPRWRPLFAAPGAEGFGPQQPLVDHLYFAQTKKWNKRALSRATAKEIWALRHELRLPSYGTVLDLQGAIRSSVIARLSGCPRRIGSNTPWERPARHFYTDRVITTAEHVIEQNYEIATAVAADELEHTLPLLPVDPVSEQWCTELLGDDAAPVVLINPGAGWGGKRWPAERYAQVSKELTRRGCRVFVNAGPGEAELAAPILAEGGAQLLEITLDQLIAFTRRTALMIAGDTGPLHLACAFNRPVVGIYGPTDPSRNGPYGTAFRVLRSPESRRNHRRTAEPEAGLLTITPEAVLAAADELLDFPEVTQ